MDKDILDKDIKSGKHASYPVVVFFKAVKYMSRHSRVFIPILAVLTVAAVFWAYREYHYYQLNGWPSCFGTKCNCDTGTDSDVFVPFQDLKKAESVK